MLMNHDLETLLLRPQSLRVCFFFLFCGFLRAFCGDWAEGQVVEGI